MKVNTVEAMKIELKRENLFLERLEVWQWVKGQGGIARMCSARRLHLNKVKVKAKVEV